MKRRLLALAALSALLLPAQGIRAEGGTAVQAEYAAQYEQAVSALLAHTPGAVVDYALRERDDGRYEWDLFFTLDGQLGECEVSEANFAVRSVILRDLPENALTPSQAVAALANEKGDMQILDLELDVDKGRIYYEGEAQQDGKRYEFEIDVSGCVTQWKRD